MTTSDHDDVVARYRRAMLRETALLACGALAVAAMVFWATTPNGTARAAVVAGVTFVALLGALGVASFVKHRRVVAILTAAVER